MIAICSADECERPIRYKALVLCQKHYFRMRRNGTLEARPLRAQRGICTINGCEELDTGPNGLCQKHLARQKRNGDANLLVGPRPSMGISNAAWQGNNVRYKAVHDRVKVRKGRADNHDCVDCGKPAKQWAYNHADPNELIEPDGRLKGLAYSTNPDCYEPKCVSCHKVSDLRRLGKALT